MKHTIKLTPHDRVSLAHAETLTIEIPTCPHCEHVHCRALAEVLREDLAEARTAHGAVLGELERGQISRDELRDGPGALEQKVAARLRRGVALLSEARQAAESERD